MYQLWSKISAVAPAFCKQLFKDVISIHELLTNELLIRYLSHPLIGKHNHHVQRTLNIVKMAVCALCKAGNLKPMERYRRPRPRHSNKRPRPSPLARTGVSPLAKRPLSDATNPSLAVAQNRIQPVKPPQVRLTTRSRV